MLWFEIESIMKVKGYNQTTLAKKMGVSQSVLSELKRGNIKKPSFELMCKVADALEVSLDSFRNKLDKNRQDDNGGKTTWQKQ